MKRIELTNGMSFLLSKAYGVVEFITESEAYTLVGVQGAVNIGERFPRVIDLFDYQPGDILQYRGTENGTDGFCVHYANERNKYVVLSRTEDVDHTIYTVRSVRSYQYYSTPLIGMFGCDGGGTTTSEDTVQLVIQHDGWTPENFLGSCWLDQLWPQAFAEPGVETEFAGQFASNYAGSQWRGHLDEAGRYVCEPTALGSPQTSAMSTVMVCDPEPTYWPVNWDEIIGRYVEGIGFTYGRYLGFEHSSEKILEGYMIAGVEYGTVTPDDIILNVLQSSWSDTRSFIGPNPTSDELALSFSTPGTSYRIIDSQGRAVLMGRSSTSLRVDVQTLSPGSYLFIQDGSAPERFMIVH
ncbi:MAG: T9SS type A sorting domain-containing protein [Flavobacteriales bacterium]|nr:T9SS type A sorting domain-containing protein [Flavobacteriales bacterium]